MGFPAYCPASAEEQKMRLIFLFLFGLGLIPLIECQNSCSRNQECVPAQSCESFVEENKKLEELRGTSGFKAQLLKLKSLVCNKAERKVCLMGQILTRTVTIL